jgi:dihydrofolate reductase
MRKLKLQVQVTVDGFIAGINGEMDWMVWNWDQQLTDYVTVITEPVDCIVLGRRLAQGFIPHWAAIANNPAEPEHDAGKWFTNTLKIVFSKTLDISHPAANGWNNTVLARNPADDITSLKEQDGKDIIVYGGASFISELIKQGLIDEYHLFVNPIAIGKGMPIFNTIEDKLNLELIQSSSFECGIVVLNYKPKSSR